MRDCSGVSAVIVAQGDAVDSYREWRPCYEELVGPISEQERAQREG
jgi:hypothetical protein